ncbi:MAG TPA: hypothetical protein PK280_01600 [Planctomycetota bacterium]|nr:hypothetical protein [Planctomycetota bacterium]
MDDKSAGQPQPPAGKGLAAGRLLLPVGLIAGTVAGAQLMARFSGFSTVAAWLIGGPLGALVGIMAAFAVLVAANAALRIMRRR